ncbi:MAG: invasion associated locus B family protein [Rhizobiales bacterium]|jgi:invasion protein IalB|nr:invasion associated locus B family protein [Hyphomicrobiales bacterium]
MLVLCLGTALAGQASPAAAQPASPPSPQQTTASFDDWIVRCETRAGPPQRKICEMVQFTQTKGQQGVLSEVAIGWPVKNQPIKMVIQVPIGIWLPTGIKLVAGAGDPGVVATFKRCIPQSCLADAEIKDDTIRRLRAGSTGGKLEFKDGNQKDVSLPVSFKGFGAAYDALLKE